MIVLTLQTAESQYPYLCEPALTNNYCPSFFLPTRGPTFSRGNPPGPAAALHTTTTLQQLIDVFFTLVVRFVQRCRLAHGSANVGADVQ